MKFRGRVHKFGDHVDTDQIIPARYLTTTDPKQLASHCMEDADPEFAKKVQPGDIIVGGVNFGCGSSREHAPVAILGSEIPCVVAKSFARIYFRNSFNLGLPAIECEEAVDDAEDGDTLEVDLEGGIVRNITKEREYAVTPMEPFIIELLEAGGLIEYTKRRLAAQNN
jgi:3-isopropylmalate/(R)-2-methylmalate dehydratase small subunit